MRATTLSVVVCASTLLAMSCGAESTYWVGAEGDWSSAQNWMYRVPGAGDYAYIDNGGTAELMGGNSSAYYIYLGAATGGRGSVSHVGGSLSARYGEFGFGSGSYGAYTLLGTGGFSADRLTLGTSGAGVFHQLAGTSRVADTHVGFQSGGAGTYNHSGGTSQVLNNMLIGNLWGSRGVYNLSGSGQLAVGGDQYVGRYGTGTFNQSGGLNAINGKLLIGYESGATGEYAIWGGALQTPQLLIGYFGAGRLAIGNASSDILISDRLVFGAGASFSAVQGSTIHLRSASFDNWGVDWTKMTGLENLRLIAEAGYSTFEVAGQDLGDTLAGFVGNFAMDTLEIGGVGTEVQLVDWRSNLTGPNVLYVKNLVIGQNSLLDLNGLTVYCQNYTDYGGTVALNGGRLVHIGSIDVPEPLSLLAFVAGLGGLSLTRLPRRHVRRMLPRTARSRSPQ